MHAAVHIRILVSSQSLILTSIHPHHLSLRESSLVGNVTVPGPFKHQLSFALTFSCAVIYVEEKLIHNKYYISVYCLLCVFFLFVVFSGCLALPKLNLQFLTLHDYLLRNFNLFRLESTYEIRQDIEDVVWRMKPW